MGAFDVISETSRCVSCGAPQPGGQQTKFLRPDFGRYFGRQITIGATFESDLRLELRRPDRIDDDYFMLRAFEGARLSLLADADEMDLCLCGRPLLARFDFDIESEGRAFTLRAVETFPLEDRSALDQVHFADLDGLFRYERRDGSIRIDARTRHVIAALPSTSLVDRRDLLHQGLLRRGALASRALDPSLALGEIDAVRWVGAGWARWLARTREGGFVLYRRSAEPKLIRGEADVLIAHLPEPARAEARASLHSFQPA